MYSLRPSTLASRRKRAIEQQSPPSRKRERLTVRSNQPSPSDDIHPTSGRIVSTFLSLPLEVRENILEYLLSLDHVIAAYKVDTICPSVNCGVSFQPRRSDIKAAFLQCISVFQTCRKLRLEAFTAFIRINTWSLEQAEFKTESLPSTRYLTAALHPTAPTRTPGNQTTAMLSDSLDKLICQKRLVQDIVHFYIKVDLSKDGTQVIKLDNWRDEPQNCALAEVKSWLESEIDQGRYTDGKSYTDMEIADNCITYLSKLVEAQSKGFCTPRSLTIDVVIHEPRFPSEGICQCGLTLKVTIEFSQTDNCRGTSNGPEAKSQLAYKPMEPKRLVFTPLLRMSNVRRVTMKRKWVLKAARAQESNANDGMCNEETDSSELIPIKQSFQYKTVQEMLAAGGPQLVEFRRIGIAATKTKGVFQVFEDKEVEQLIQDNELSKCREPFSMPQPTVSEDKWKELRKFGIG